MTIKLKLLLVLLCILQCGVFSSAFAMGETPSAPQDADKAILQFHSYEPKQKLSRDAKKAIAKLYGGSYWEDQGLVEHFGGPSGFVTPVFEQRYTEEGVEKLLVMAYLTPGPSDMDAPCHVCALVVGGAIFKKENSKWVVESSQKIMSWGTTLMGAGFSLVPISPTKFGVAIATGDYHSGFEAKGIELFIPLKDKLVSVLNAGFGDTPGEGACGESIKLKPQNIHFKFDEGSDQSGYFDIAVNTKYNEGDCEHFTRHDETKRYHFQNGKYVLIQ